MDKTGQERLLAISESDTTLLRDSEGTYWTLLWHMAQKRCEDEGIAQANIKVWFNGFVRGVESTLTLNKFLEDFERGEDEISKEFRRVQGASKRHDSDPD